MVTLTRILDALGRGQPPGVRIIGAIVKGVLQREPLYSFQRTLPGKPRSLGRSGSLAVFLRRLRRRAVLVVGVREVQDVLY